MELKFEYGRDVLVLPGRVGSMLHNAKDGELKVLVALCAAGGAADPAELAAATGCSEEAVQEALHTWLEAGVLVEAQESLVKEAAVTAKKTEKPVSSKAKPSRHDKLPQYTTEELADLLEKRKDTATLLDECQKVWGKMFNTHEVNIILGLVDYLGLEWEYVLSLLAYCEGLQSKRGVRRSLHYVETMAFGLYDDGICTAQALYDKLRQLDQMAEAEGQLRTLFGMGDRTLTPQEKKYFSTWIYEFGYDLEIIRKAYEITVDTKGSPKMSYMNSVLANWNRDGLRTIQQIEEAQTAYNESKKKERGGKTNQDSTQQGTFDTEDFFEVAVRRSLGDDFDPAVLKTN